MEDKFFKFMENNNPNAVIVATALIIVVCIALINLKIAITLIVGVSIVGYLFFIMMWKSVYDYHKNNR